MIISKNSSTFLGAINVITAAIAIVYLWWVILNTVGTWALLNAPAGYHLLLQHLAGVVFLLAAIIPYQRWIAPIGFGHIWQRSSLSPAAAIFAVYFLDYSYSKLDGYSPETWVIDLLNQPLEQLISVFFTILLFAPIGEEIVFRGILLNVFRTSRKWTTWVGVVVIALLFAAIHTQYQKLSTFLEMMVLSAIFSWARMRSGGLALPVLLHAFASLLAVFFVWLS